MSLTSWKKQFIILWIGQSVSVLTSAVVQMALVWYLTIMTESAAVMAIGSLMGFIPRAIIGPFAGVIIDRFSRKKVMILSDFFIAGISLIPVFYGFFNELPVWLIMFVLFCRSLGSAFHMPALQALTPAIVPKENLVQYAGFAHAFDSVARLMSPALAAILFRLFSMNVLMLLDVVGAVFAVFMLSFIAIPKAEISENAQHKGYLAEFKEGISIIRGEPAVVFILIISGLYAIIYAPIGTFYPLITITHFNGSVADSALVETILSIGTLLGAFALGIVGKRINKMRSFALSILVYGACLVVTGLIPNSAFIVFVGLSAVLGASIPFYSSIRASIIQLKFAPEYLGRIFALVSSVTTFTMPIGLILGGMFAQQVGIANWFLISGVAAVVLGTVAIVNPHMKGE